MVLKSEIGSADHPLIADLVEDGGDQAQAFALLRASPAALDFYFENYAGSLLETIPPELGFEISQLAVGRDGPAVLQFFKTYGTTYADIAEVAGHNITSKRLSSGISIMATWRWYHEKEEANYETLDITINNTRDAVRGRDIYYKCNICHSIISSTPRDDAGCACGNIGIDRDMIRLFVRDFSNFVILRAKA